MVLSATVWLLKTTSGFGKTGNSVSERRLTRDDRNGRETRYLVRLQKSHKRRLTSDSAYVEIGSRNMAETA